MPPPPGPDSVPAVPVPPSPSDLASPGPSALIQLESKIYTAPEARLFAPAVKSCYLCIKAGSAWEIRYLDKPYYPKSLTMSFVVDDEDSHFVALRTVLRWAWDAHCELHIGATCPYNLGM